MEVKWKKYQIRRLNMKYKFTWIVRCGKVIWETCDTLKIVYAIAQNIHRSSNKNIYANQFGMQFQWNGFLIFGALKLLINRFNPIKNAWRAFTLNIHCFDCVWCFILIIDSDDCPSECFAHFHWMWWTELNAICVFLIVTRVKHLRRMIKRRMRYERPIDDRCRPGHTIRYKMCNVRCSSFVGCIEKFLQFDRMLFVQQCRNYRVFFSIALSLFVVLICCYTKWYDLTQCIPMHTQKK